MRSADLCEFHIAYATSVQFESVDHDLPHALPAFAAAGIEVDVVPWDSPQDWGGYDLVVVRSTWDYVPRRTEFLAWAESVPRLANPADLLRWNTDKHYLRDLARAGLPVVTTQWVAPADQSADQRAASTPDPEWDEWVVKPNISAGARDTTRYRRGDEAASQAHVSRLVAGGRTAMVQPYLRTVDVAGETACIFLGGSFSHGVRKGALLAHGAGEIAHEDYVEHITPRQPAPDELALAAATLAVVPGGADRLLYARVDVVRAADGSPTVLEVELTEPSLFLSLAPSAAERFAAAVRAVLS